MTHTIRSLMSAAAVAASLLLVAGHGAAQTSSAKGPGKSDQPDDLERYLCKDVVRMTGDDRIIALAAMHGYMLGRKGSTKYVPAELSKTSDAFVEHCLSNPNDKALQAFGKLAK